MSEKAYKGRIGTAKRTHWFKRADKFSFGWYAVAYCGCAGEGFPVSMDSEITCRKCEKERPTVLWCHRK